MKKLIQLPVLLCTLVLLGACSTVNSRINEKSAVYNSLDPTTQSKISHGDIDIGFTPDMVYMALGQPDLRRESVSTKGQTETWIYRTYYGDYADPGMIGFHGYHRWYAYNPYGRYYRFYWEPFYVDEPVVAEDNIRVTFQNGRVIMIDQVKT